MGTRNLTTVIYKEKVRIAQYGQWDGYPSGQSATVLTFLRDIMRPDTFRKQLEKCRWMNKKDEKELDKWLISIGSNDGGVTSEQALRYHERYPLLTRDNGAKILSMVYICEDKEIMLVDSSDFAQDSLMCEWAYVIDLDKNTFEVFKGFNKEPLKKSERFYSTKKDEQGYYSVKHLKSYSLNHLPTDKQFIDELEPSD